MQSDGRNGVECRAHDRGSLGPAQLSGAMTKVWTTEDACLSRDTKKPTVNYPA